MAPNRNNTFRKHLFSYLIIILSNAVKSKQYGVKLNTKNETLDQLTELKLEKRSADYLLGYRDSELNFTELTAKYGYKSEEYTVETDDGYLLTMFRIVDARKCKEPKRRPPVIIQHGLTWNSDCFVEPGPGNALGYLLADACYDVWFPNQRGNNYGRRHLHLNPDKDKEFWNFSVDEIGKFDIPAMIDTVLHHTGAKKVNYIGHSQGCGTFYIMCSEKPKYCKYKVNLKISLAPATRHLNTKAPGFRLTTEFFYKFQPFIEALGIYEALPKNGVVQTFLDNLCRFKAAYPVCLKILAYVDGFNPGSIPFDTLKDMFGQLSGTSVKNLARYGQAVNSKSFKKFDYGLVKNLKVYGKFSPPVFNLKAVSTPTVIFYGNNDGIVDKADVKWLIPKLGNVIDVIEVTDPFWTHFDFLYSQYIPKYIFDQIDQYLRLFSYVDTL